MTLIASMACVPFGFAWAWLWDRILNVRASLLSLLFYSAWALVCVAFRWWYAAGMAFGYLAYVLWSMWQRRGRDRAAQLLGEKSRALRDALVRRAREAARPSPVRRPALDGAR